MDLQETLASLQQQLAALSVRDPRDTRTVAEVFAGYVADQGKRMAPASLAWRHGSSSCVRRTSSSAVRSP